jgi:hypothetical protein
MNAIPYDPPDQDWDEPEGDAPAAFPARPRRRLGGPLTALLLALFLGAIGFYVGIRVEKGQLPSSAATTSGAASRLAALAGRTGTGAGAAGGGGAGFARAFGAGGAGNATVGTISAVNGKTLFLTDVSGNTVKVKLSSATAITKSLSVSRVSVHPGDTVIVQGLKGSGGTITATSVSDSGVRSTGTGSGSATGSGSGSSTSSSAVNSLFGSGSGG